jgi:hypothetical protein
MLKFAHDQRSDREKQQGDPFRPTHHKRRDRNVTLVPVPLSKALKPAGSDENETSK